MRPALLLLLLGGHAARALMFASDVVSKQWDTWGFYENATFYAYYLVTEVSYGEGFGVATSPDGQHWTDHGYVWKGPSWTQRHLWEGTSAVWRAPDYAETGRYLINYSQMNSGGCKCQNITFAQSFDLIHWDNANETDFPWFNIDASAGYKVQGGRWDTIYSIPVPAGEGGHPEGGLARGGRDGYPRYGFWSASPDNSGGGGGGGDKAATTASSATNGSFGFGITHDGTDWQALPAPTMLPEPVGIGAELGALDWVPAEDGSPDGGAYVAMIGYGWPRTMLSYVSPASPKGPYTRSARNVNFLNGSCYYSRFFHGPDNALLVTHQTWDNRGTHTSFVSPYKRAVIDAQGTFRLKWWAPNENLKGDEWNLPASGPPSSGADPFYPSSPQLPFPAANASGGGLLLEAEWTVPAADKAAGPAEWPGFLLETAAPGAAVFVGLDPHGVVGVGAVKLSKLPSQCINYTDPAGPAGATVPATPDHSSADWEFAAGAGSSASKVAGGLDIRSGGPGGLGLALVSRPLLSQGHLLASASISFQYAAGYGCTAPGCAGPPSASLVVVDAYNHTLVATLWTSGPLDKYSFDVFKGYSPPVTGGAAGLRVGWPRQTQLALLFNNSKRNLQVPIPTLSVTLGWSEEKQPGPWAPAPPAPPQFAVQERWSRDLDYLVPGKKVHARLLARRSMLEMYIDDHLFPVYAAPDQSGRFGVSGAALVANVQAWNMSIANN